MFDVEIHSVGDPRSLCSFCRLHAEDSCEGDNNENERKTSEHRVPEVNSEVIPGSGKILIIYLIDHVIIWVLGRKGQG